MAKAYGRIQGNAQVQNLWLQSSSYTGIFATTTAPLDCPVEGCVYGTALNYQGELAKLGPKLHEKPYLAPPKAPILYIKPKNTLIAHETPIPFPEDSNYLEVGAALGIVFKEQVTNVSPSEAWEKILGFTIVNDLCVPHDNIHRPAVKYNARDGYCPIGPWIVDRDDAPNPDSVAIRVYVNDELQQTSNTKQLVRNVRQLISDVSTFLSFNPGDVLLVGTPENRPLIQHGDTVSIEIEGIGMLTNTTAVSKEGVQ
ncbi:hypothetical protein DH09_16355 [Bacillaceae bacterium JMAK1]|nr:hypothetical protein DH09_16355 [Bacillaceae bacterium JMAK1]